MMKHFWRYVIIFALIIGSCTAAFSAEDDKYIVLEVEGEGRNRNEAVESAWLTGIREAVGSYIDAKTELNNDQLTERIISYSRGLVERYDVLSVDDSKANDGIYKVRLKLYIVQDKLRDGAKHASSGSAVIAFSPADIRREREELDAKAARELAAKNAAEQTAKKKSQTGAELLNAMLARYKPEDFLSCYFPGQPESVKDKPDTYTVKVEINFNEKLYKESFIPDLVQVLDQVAASKKNTMLVTYKNELRNIAAKKSLQGDGNSIISKVFENEKFRNYSLAVYNRPERFGVRLYNFSKDDSENIYTVLSDFIARTKRVQGIILELIDEDKEVLETITHEFPVNFLMTSSQRGYVVHPTMMINNFENKQFIDPINLEMPEEIIPFVKNIKASLLLGAEVKQGGLLGIRIKEIAGNNAKITQVKADSPAASAGLKVDDVISTLSVNGKVSYMAKDFEDVINNLKEGDEVKVTFYRDSKRQEITIQL